MQQTLKEWLEYLQENGDDGTGHCDYAPSLCKDCELNENT
jgi:hypothetical protein